MIQIHYYYGDGSVMGDILAMRDAPSCYASYRETIEKSDVIEKIGNKAYFEIFGEDFAPVLDDLTAQLPCA